LVPLAGGDSDVGIGGGAVASLAKFDPDFRPYRWRTEMLALTTFRPNGTGALEIPFQDYYLQIVAPNLAERAL
jgi:hypothetical protein